MDLCRSLCHNPPPLCFHANVRVARQHLRRDVPCNLPDDAVIGLRLSELRDGVMTQIVEPKPVQGRPHGANIGLAVLVPAGLCGLL